MSSDILYSTVQDGRKFERYESSGGGTEIIL